MDAGVSGGFRMVMGGFMSPFILCFYLAEFHEELGLDDFQNTNL